MQDGEHVLLDYLSANLVELGIKLRADHHLFQALLSGSNRRRDCVSQADISVDTEGFALHVTGYVQ